MGEAHTVQEFLDSTDETNVLQHVFLSNDGKHYIVRLTDGTEIAKVERVVGRGKKGQSPAAVLRAVLEQLVCAACGLSLLAGEREVCGMCEAKQVRELREMRDQLSD